MAGGLKGKNFAMPDYFITGEGKAFFNPGGGTYRGDGVVQDGKIVTSGICPVMALFVKKPDGTLELTKSSLRLCSRRRKTSISIRRIAPSSRRQPGG